ncbi:MAG TPA: transcription-repair coupling factor [Cyclobacteriaceae bacterium]|nr:transcription-repair coupling factor [Cyclobacteriaceae bacterium]HMV07768.1 transcription-repair coupling factor [Cyclobacteriaceae bacterium]HMV88036.1 transcription-repair coupling factor [Cyclobacteriaceae bacterium]HMW98903.1 transcription-repair coupling factor [Cyclobacteriaceae bacterium]HMX48464.1 transcription-repair coupling factor [Cyclobacteriaceae bacterium]
MRAQDFLNIYCADGLIKTVAAGIHAAKNQNIRLKGLAGSFDAVITASSFKLHPHDYFIVLQDKEEAAYFQNDLQNLLGREILLFPMSYKRPYEFLEIENANILMRAEVLNRLAEKTKPEIIVTYPEALSEKVINKRSLATNTFTVKLKEKLEIPFLEEFLHSYDFEKTDFVYEAGQFSVRGGIIDVFSFAHELPYRIELFGDEVDSIRSFDPGSQLSVDTLTQISIIPNVQTKLMQEERQSLLDFIAPTTRLWFKDFQLTLDVLKKSFEKAEESFDSIVQQSGAQVVLKPEQLFEVAKTFKSRSESFQRIEFGSRAILNDAIVFDLPSAAQPSFNKNFELLAGNLVEHQAQGYSNFIAADIAKQQDRLKEIFEEIHPEIRFQPLEFALREGFVDQSLKIVCYTDHQIFERFHRYRSKEKFSKSKAITLRELHTLQPGDFVTHIDYGIGKFAGLEKKEVNGHEQESIRLVYRDNDLLYVSIHALHKISKYSGKDGTPPQISKLGSQEWESKKAKVKGKVKDIAKELISLYAKRKTAPGFSFSPDSYLQAELESSFLYEDTPDQARATEDVKRDMQEPHPMDRLICGDVGFGKTEVAIRAAFKATADGKQVAVLVPTTILAMQHHRTFRERLRNLPVRVDYISRFRTEKEIKKIIADVKEGKVDILVGTHRVVSKDIEFKDLGLLIVDEEQKFGVKVKDRLKELKVNVDVLTLTATPIPRTLHFSLMGARDLSIISTPPPNRQPVTTELHTFDEKVIRDAVSYELRRGGQVFFVHNRVSDIDSVANTIYKLVPDAKIGIAHGQMEGDKLERAMMKFIDAEYDVLVSTNIIESGLDIPNANTIIINQAHMFGLSDLHQMRGRVGRSNKKAFCYLLTPPASLLTSDSRKRLAALEEFSDLGDGFKVAMRDLDIRGAGNLLGGEQSGFINDLGFETYHKILDDAIQELKENDFRELFAVELAEKAKIIVQDCVIETDLEILIPETYVNNTSERLQLYARLDNIKDEEQLKKFSNELGDRFGEIPPAVHEMINSVRLRWLGEELGFEKISLKNDRVRGYFVTGNDAYFNSEIFGLILKFAQNNPRRCKIKDQGGKPLIVIENVPSVDAAIELFDHMIGRLSRSDKEIASK